MKILLSIVLFFLFLIALRLRFDIDYYKKKYEFLQNDIKYSKAITIDDWVYRCNKVLSNVGSEPLRKEQ